MSDGPGSGGQMEPSRGDLLEDYVGWYRRPGSAAQPCRDGALLERAARYLLAEPELAGAFTVFPFCQVVPEERESDGKHLSAVIRAVELLETLCVNLFLQPWRKEITTLKPVFRSSTIQSVLACIGYLPHADAPQTEYRLCGDVNPDRAMVMGFELLLARVECIHLLELLEQDQAGPKAPPPLDSRPAGKPEPEPQGLDCQLSSVDQSIMEMQRTYPDLAIRGRPLLPDKPRRAISKRSRKAILAAGTSNNDDGGAPHSNSAKAAATATGHKNYCGKACEMIGDHSKGSASSERDSGGATSSGKSTAGADGSGADDELRGLQDISLHITLRAGSSVEQSVDAEESPITAQPPAWTQQQATADLPNKRPPKPENLSANSINPVQKLRELAELMDQLHVRDTKVEVKRKEDKRGEMNTNIERRKKGRQARSESQTEEKSLRKPIMGAKLSHAASRSSRTSQSDATAPKEPPEHLNQIRECLKLCDETKD